MSRGPLLIVGATGRAAAASAIRAGYSPHVIDLFADADTQRIARTIRCPAADYPNGLVDLASRVPSMPWMYTGGLENHPDIVDAISSNRPLIGNGGVVLRAIRDPFKLADAIRAVGGRFPETHPGTDFSGADRDKRWLRKSLASAGGLGVQDIDLRLRNDLTDRECVQEFIPGEAISGAFDGDALLGVCRQESGVSWLHAPPHHYCGNIRHDYRNYHAEFVRIGQHLARAFSLSGRWGLDAIATPDSVHYLEVNPRYTASMELLEHSTTTGIAKAIYYAAKRIEFPATGPWEKSLANCLDVTAIPAFADIPVAGTVIARGPPVLTFFVAAPSVFLGLFNMKETAAELDRLFGVAT